MRSMYHVQAKLDVSGNDDARDDKGCKGLCEGYVEMEKEATSIEDQNILMR